MYCSFLVSVNSGRTLKGGQNSCCSDSQVVGSLFFHLCNGQLLHSVLTLVFQILTEDAAVHFAVSSPRVCLKVSLTGTLLPTHNCSEPLMLLLNFCSVCHLFQNVHHVEVPCTSSSLVQLLGGSGIPRPVTDLQNSPSLLCYSPLWLVIRNFLMVHYGLQFSYTGLHSL